MDFYVMAKSYDSYGQHPSQVDDFLLRQAPDFGEAIKQISVTLHLKSAGPPKKTLEDVLVEHERYRSTLPKVIYRRAKGQVEIDVASELLDDWQLSPERFASVFDEVIQALTLMRKRVKASDAFDLAAFLRHCEAARQRIPATEAELQTLDAELASERQAKYAAMSPWEKLGIDWDDFHPAAREILDDPFYWDGVDDFSPNGNDTGADLLHDYRGWLLEHADKQPTQFLEGLAKDWGVGSFDAMDPEIRDEAAIGLAFADIKLRGSCDPGARELALASVNRQRKQALACVEESLRENRLQALDMIERKLRQVPG